MGDGKKEMEMAKEHPKEAGMAAGMAANTVAPGSGFVVAPLVEQHLNQENAKDDAKEEAAKEDDAAATPDAPSPKPKKSDDKKNDNSTAAYGENLMDKSADLQKNLYSGLHKSLGNVLMSPFKMMLSPFKKMFQNPVDNAANKLPPSNQGGAKQEGGQNPDPSADSAPPTSPDVSGGMTPPM